MKLLINNKEFNFFSSYSVTLKYNAIASSFSFTGVYDFLSAFLTYSQVKILNDSNELLITGTIVNETRSKGVKPTQLTCSGYSFCGVLEDVSIPLSLYPLQSDNRNLFEIIKRFTDKFGISVIKQGSEIESALTKQYDKSTAEASDSIKSYINNLCSQRGIILTHDKHGNLVLSKGDIIPTAIKIENVISYSLTVNGQALHSEISVIRQAAINNPDGGEFTIYNSNVKAFRPKVKILSDGDLFDVETAAKNELRAELATLQLSIESKDFFKPGQVIELEVDPKVPYKKWFIEETTITGTTKGEKYNYKAVPAEVYQK